MIRLLTILGAVLLAPAAFAQSTPQAAFARFVDLANAGKLTTPEGQALLTGEAKAAATDARSNLTAADRILPIGADKAAARVVLKGRRGEELDAYFYLEKSGGRWAVAAHRAMPPTPIDVLLLDQMKKQPVLSPGDQLVRINTLLAVSTDGQLRTWFNANRAALDAFADAAQPPTRAALNQIGLVAYKKTDGVIRLTIDTSPEGDEIGLLRAKPGVAPAVNPANYIWVEDFGGGWSLFRKQGLPPPTHG